MSHRTIRFKFSRLIIPHDKLNVDTVWCDIAAVEAKAGVCFGSTFLQLGGVARGLGAIEPNPVDQLHH